MSGFTRTASLPPSLPADVGAAQPLAAPVWPQTAGACDQLLIDPGPGYAHWTVDYVRHDELSGGQTLVNLEDVVRMRFPTMAENRKAAGHIAFMLNKVATAIRVPRDLLVHDRPARAIVGDADVQLERAVDSQVHVTPSTMLSYVETGDTKSGWNGDSKALLVAGLKRLQLVAAAQGSGGGAVVDLLRRYSELESPDMQSFLREAAKVLAQTGRTPAEANEPGAVAYRLLRVLASASVDSDDLDEDSLSDGAEAAVGAGPDPTAGPETVSPALLAVLQAMFRQREALYLALVPGHKERLLRLFKLDGPAFVDARTTATLTLYIEEGLSYDGISRLNMMFEPLANMLGSPELFATRHDTRAAFKTFKSEFVITDHSIRLPQDPDKATEPQDGRAAISVAKSVLL